MGLLGVAHLAHDTYPAFVGVMLPLLIPKLGLSLAAAGLLASGIRWTTSLQPVIGYWADRTDARWWVVIPPTTTAVLIGLLGVAPSFAVALGLLLLAGLSHASFHPAAAAMATRAAGKRWGKASSYFMTGGELGRTVGPLLAGAILAVLGLEWVLVGAVAGVAMSVVLHHRFRRLPPMLFRRPPGDLRAALRARRRPAAVLGMVMILRNVANVGLVVFLPTFAAGEGAGILVAGLTLALYEVGGTVGAFFGGTASDHLGRRGVLAAGVGAAAPLLIGGLVAGPNAIGLVLLALGGVALLSGHPVQLAYMQELFPDNRSAAVGLNYLMNSIGGIAASIAVGALGEALGLRPALMLAIGVGLAATPFILVLPRRPHPAG